MTNAAWRRCAGFRSANMEPQPRETWLGEISVKLGPETQGSRRLQPWRLDGQNLTPFHPCRQSTDLGQAQRAAFVGWKAGAVNHGQIEHSGTYDKAFLHGPGGFVEHGQVQAILDVRRGIAGRGASHPPDDQVVVHL